MFENPYVKGKNACTGLVLSTASLIATQGLSVKQCFDLFTTGLMTTLQIFHNSSQASASLTLN